METGWISDAEREALWLSLRVASMAVAMSLPFALATALLLGRGRFPGKMIVDGIVHLPLVLPPVVVGYLLLVTLGRRAPVGAWLWETFGIQFIFTTQGAALASAIVVFPFQVRAIRIAVEAADRGLLAAARTLGAGPTDAFLTVTLPLIMPGIVAGAITAFAASLGEFGAIITFVSNIPGETRTLPLAIYSAIQTPGGTDAAVRLVALSITLAFAGLLLADLAGRRVRRLIGQD